MHLHHEHLHKRQFLSDIQDGISDLTNLFDGDGSGSGDGGDGGRGKKGSSDNNNDNSNSPPPDNNGGAATLVSLVFVTASKNFDGPVRGWTTVGAPEATPPPAAQTQPQSPQAAPTESPNSPDSGAAATSAPAHQNNTPTNTPSKSLLNSIHVTSIGNTPTNTQSSLPGTILGAAASGTASSQPSVDTNSQSTGLSGGAKAGIAFGVILGLIAFAGAGFAVYRYRKRQQTEEGATGYNEKNPFGDSAAAAPPPPPPSHARTMASSPEIPSALGPIGASQGIRNPEMQSANPANPFGNHAESIFPPAAVHGSTPTAAPSAMSATNEAEKAALAVGAGAAAVGAVAASRKSGAPAPLNVMAAQTPGAHAFKGPASPAGSQFSVTSMSSTAIATGAPASNVHRVQLDFKPSMDDELELKAGQLIRLLHEYDDGWALCIRLDRSQQGVVPRTCLSTRPVKPRNAPSNGAPRAGPPPGMRAPPSRTGSPVPRSMSPSLSPATTDPTDPTKRSMSPGPYGGGPQQPTKRGSSQRARSNSASHIDPRRGNPPGPSPMNPAYTNKSPIQIPAALQPAIPRPLTPSGQAVAPISPTPSVGSVQRKPVPGSK